jgi:hypothetical protein
MLKIIIVAVALAILVVADSNDDCKFDAKTK